jgi:hypothetical protein
MKRIQSEVSAELSQFSRNARKLYDRLRGKLAQGS